MLFASYLLALAAALAIKDEYQPLKYTMNKGVCKKSLAEDDSSQVTPKPQKADLWVDGFYYMIDVDIGTKGQKVSVEIDTGSADLWVDKLVLNDLSGWKNLSEPYSIWYYDLTLLHGWFGTSLIWLNNGLEVEDFQWAVATDVNHNTNKFQGMFGVGRVENENSKKPYPNFVQRLKDLGHIKTNGYSYYLNKKDATSGSIIFGGIDKAKIKGKVATVPLTTGTPNSRFDNLVISKITGINGEVLGENIEAFMDTGLTVTRLPPSIVKQIQDKVPNSVRSDGTIFVPCQMDRDLYVLMWFDDVEIRITLDDLAIKARDNNGKWTGDCTLGVAPTTENVPVHLGVSSLSHMYVTVDHDHNVAYISNVNYTDEEDIVLL